MRAQSGFDGLAWMAKHATSCFAMLCVALGYAAASPSALAQTDISRGKEIFEDICTACHSLRPPPEDAPPMLMVVTHYLDKHETIDRVRAAMRAWITEPSAENSSIPEHAIERWGLMPDLELPQEEVEAVIAFLLDLHSKEDMDAMHEKADSLGHGMMMRMDSTATCPMMGTDSTATCPMQQKGDAK